MHGHGFVLHETLCDISWVEEVVEFEWDRVWQLGRAVIAGVNLEANGQMKARCEIRRACLKERGMPKACHLLSGAVVR